MEKMRIFAESARKAEVDKTIQEQLPNQNSFDLLGLLNVAYGVAGVVAVIFIIVAGIQYVTSTGDPSKASRALRTIIFALVGLVIVVAAAALSNLILGAAGEAK